MRWSWVELSRSLSSKIVPDAHNVASKAATVALCVQVSFGGPSETRTPDPLIKSCWNEAKLIFVNRKSRFYGGFAIQRV
jgi:hypothetical protein